MMTPEREKAIREYLESYKKYNIVPYWTQLAEELIAEIDRLRGGDVYFKKYLDVCLERDQLREKLAVAGQIPMGHIFTTPSPDSRPDSQLASPQS